MATNALKGQSTLVEVGDGAPGTYNTIGEITDFDGPGGSATIINATHLQSTAQEKLMGLPDEGQFSMTLNFDPTDTNGQNRCRALRAAQTLGYFRVTFTDSPATVATFTAFVMEYRISGAVDDKVNLNITLEITDSVTFT